ncbi:MAG TPA: dolichyl-phosphate beta-glucosyltransferase [Acidimicrobiales bacterium]|nr:dolichyl-phosphate beta-glucosyltransferase [Acidimicrobiales bacterium]
MARRRFEDSENRRGAVVERVRTAIVDKNPSIVESRTARSRISKSIVIPAFNETARLEESLPRLLECFDWGEEEIVFVDDGSHDDTLMMAKGLLESVPNCTYIQLSRNCGKGGAIRAGVSQARGTLIAYADADMASDPKGFARLFGTLSDCEVAIGSRALADSTVNCRDPGRILFGRAFNRFVRSISDLEIADTQCGFKAFRGPAAKLLFHASKIEGYAFDVEILMLARKLGMRTRQVPVDWTDVKGSHVRPLLDSAPMAADVVRTAISWRNSTPIEALTILSTTNGSRHGPPEVLAALEKNLRYGDPVISWPRGAIALLPCLDHMSVLAIRKRLVDCLPLCRVQQSYVSMEMLIHPSSAPLMAAVRSLPQPANQDVAVVCDQGTASTLLSSLGVA